MVLREAESALAGAKHDGRNCERTFAAPEAEPVQDPGPAMHLVRKRSTQA